MQAPLHKSPSVLSRLVPHMSSSELPSKQVLHRTLLPGPQSMQAPLHNSLSELPSKPHVQLLVQLNKLLPALLNRSPALPSRHGVLHMSLLPGPPHMQAPPHRSSSELPSRLGVLHISLLPGHPSMQAPPHKSWVEPQWMLAPRTARNKPPWGLLSGSSSVPSKPLVLPNRSVLVLPRS